MKNLFIFNEYGINEIVEKEKVGVEFVEESDWEKIEVESNIIKEYGIYDGVLRVKVEEKWSEEEVLEEVNKLDELLW